MEKAENKQELPKLPKGEGTLRYAHGGKILYRKSIPVDGDYRRLAVTGHTLKECFDAICAAALATCAPTRVRMVCR